MLKLTGQRPGLPEILRPEDVASSLRVTLYFVLGFSVYGLIGVLRSPGEAWESVALNSVLLLLASGFALFCLQLKKMELAIYIALIANALVLAYSAWTGAGVNGVAYAGLILPVLAAALFLGPRAGYVSALIATLMGAFLFVAGRMGWLVNIDRPITPVVAWLANILFFFVAAHQIAVSLRQVERALHKAHDEIMERTRTEAEIRRLNTEQEKIIAERAAQLAESEMRYRLIAENADDMIWTLDMNLRPMYLSPSLLRSLGYTSEEDLSQLTVEQALMPSSLQKALAIFEEEVAKASREPDPAHVRMTELEYKRKDGTTFWGEAKFVFLRDADLNLIGVLGVSRDITERNRIEAALRASEERYRLISSVSSDYMFSTRLGPSGQLELNWVTGAFESITGYTFEEYVAHGGWRACLHPYDLAQDDRDFAQLGRNEPVITEVRTITKSGQTRWVRVYAHPVWDVEQVRLTGIYGAVQDITKRKEAEADLRASEQRFRALVEQLPVITYMDDVKTFGKTNYISPQLETFLGITPEVWVAGDLDFWVDHMHPDDRARAVREFEACFHNGLPVDSEYRLIGQDGRELWFHDRSVRVDDAAGHPQFIMGVMTDITERKHSEQQLEQQTAQLTVLHQLGQEIVASLDMEQVYASAHRAVEQLIPMEAFYIAIVDNERSHVEYDYLFDQGERWPKEIRPFDTPNLSSHVLKTGEPLFIEDDAAGASKAIGYTLFGTRDDTRSVMIVPLKFGGNVIGVISAQHYQPMMYTAEHLKLLTMLANQVAIAIQNARLVESLRLQTVALEAAANAIVITNHDNIIQWTNPAFTRLTGYTAEEALGHNPNLLRSGKHDNAFYQQMWATLNAGEVWHGEIINRRKDGSLYTEEQMITPVHDGQGNIFRFIAVKQDVSERKKAEEALRASEARFRQLIASAPDAIIGVDEAGTILLANTQATELFGYFLDELLGKNVDLLLPEHIQGLHESHRAIYIAQPRARSMGTGMELHARRKDGSEFAVEISLSHLDTETGMLITAFVRDITERKKAELEIQRQRDFALQVMNAMSQGLTVTNHEGAFEYVNPAAAHMLGYEPRDLIGKRSIDVIISEEIPKLEEARKQRRLGKASTYEARLQHADGRQVEVMINGAPRLENGAYRGSITVVTDLTERKQTEAREQRRREMLEKVVDLGKAVTQINDLQECLREIHQSVQLGLGFDRVGLFKYDSVNRQVCGVFGTSATGEVEDTSWFKQSVGAYDAWERALSDPHGMSVIDNYRTFHQVAPDNEMKNVRQHVTLAAWAGEQPVALITADNAITQRLFTSEQLEALHLFAGYAGLAIKNAQWNDELERRVIERTTELEAANRELESISYTIGHDLRSPVRAMVGYSRMVLQNYGEQIEVPGRSDLEHIHAAAKRMGQLVDDFLMFLRLGRTQLRVQPMDMKALVSRVIKESRSQNKDRQFEFIVKRLVRNQGDPELLVQVWYHLISNAIKFTRPRALAQIEIGSLKKEGQTCYYIRDNGIGFDMRYAEKLFNVFQRLNRQEEFEGTGMGLAIVERIIARHGGRIWVEAEVDKGATFYFTLSEQQASNHE